MKKQLSVVLFLFFFPVTMVAGISPAAYATEYKIDPEHSFVEFRIHHLGFSWLHGRFNVISGVFNYDTASVDLNNITVNIETDSIDTNHAERDKHLRSKDFLEVKKYPKAIFKGTKYTGGARAGIMEGTLTLHGVTKPLKINVEMIGEGEDPWGKYRAGFAGTVTLDRRDFGVAYDLGPTGDVMEFQLNIEGIRK